MRISVEHIGLPARDVIALKDWYIRVLDGKMIFTNGEIPGIYFVEIPGATFEIYSADFSSEVTADNKLAGFRHIALRVESIDAAKAELEKRGVKFTEQLRPAAGGGRVLFFSDCEGNLLHLLERPADAAYLKANG